VLTLIIVAVVLVGGLAFLMRGGSSETYGGGGDAPSDPKSGAPDDTADEDDDADEWVEAAAITSDGYAFVPHGARSVELIPPGEDEDALDQAARASGDDAMKAAAKSAPVNPHTGRRLVTWKPGQSLQFGDLIAARVVRGAPGLDPWRLECLGRDRDYRPFAFETQEAARIACELLQSRIVSPPRDESGEPIPIGIEEEFMVARRAYDATIDALENPAEDDEPHPR
jgi:hypothetical protein